MKLKKVGNWWIADRDIKGEQYKSRLNRAKDKMVWHRFNCEISGEDQWLQQFIRANSRRGSYIDVGAAYGFTSVPLSDHFKKIYCFEPMFTTYRALHRNCLEYDNIRCFNYACSNEHRSYEAFYQPNNPMVSQLKDSTGVPNPFRAERVWREEVVNAIRLDDMFPTEEITCIKVDVEGHEMHVLAGAVKLLERSKALVIVESQNDRRPDGSYSHYKIKKFMEQLGYQFKGMLYDSKDSKTYGYDLVWKKS